MPSLTDQVGHWTEIKEKIIEEYFPAYTKILNKQQVIRKFIYIDAFAGPGEHLSRKTGELVKGSPLRALETKPQFSHYFFIELDQRKAQQLRDKVAERKDVTILQGDCNKLLLEEVFPQCRYEAYCRALCFLDPYKLNLNWEVVETAGKMKSIEIFLNFMMMDANRNVLWKNPDLVPEDQIKRMNAVWGDSSWRESAYKEQKSLFTDMDKLLKQPNIEVAKAYKKRLQKIAGYKHVLDPIPMKNTRSATIYYLFFASNNDKGASIMRSIFKKYRAAGIIYGN
jgi:three-Cys-motif partner protein